METQFEYLAEEYVSVLHAECGGEALWFNKLHLMHGAPISVDHVIWPDGEPAMFGDPLVCYCCGHPINIAVSVNHESAKAFTRNSPNMSIQFHSNFQPIN